MTGTLFSFIHVPPSQGSGVKCLFEKVSERVSSLILATLKTKKRAFSVSYASPAPPKPQEDETATPTNVLTPYNAISLNDDNKNDYFHIESIEEYPDNIVRIYNKEGLKVFEITGYDNKNQSFKGFTQGEVAVKKSLELPVGTYFYFIEYTDENHQLQRKKGWLYLKK